MQDQTNQCSVSICDYEDFKTAMSAPKLSLYENKTGGQFDRAFTAYLMNCDLACAFWEPIHYCEVALRNTIARALVAKYKSNWFSDHAFRNTLSQEQVSKLDAEIKSLSQNGNADDLVAKLSFRFWESLLNKKYLTTIWDGKPSNYFHFSDPISEEDILVSLSDWVSNTRKLRNRIAHQEEIFYKPNIGKVLTGTLKTLACCSYSTHKIISKKQRVSFLLRKRKKFINLCKNELKGSITNGSRETS